MSYKGPAMSSFSHLMCPLSQSLRSVTSFETERGSLLRGQTCQLVQSGPWRTTSRRLKSISPWIYLCSEPMLLLGQKKKHEAKGLAIQEQENSFRTPLEI